MKEANDKEKSIKPNWITETRNWIGRMMPGGSGLFEEYFKIVFHSDPGWEGDELRKVMRVVIEFFTHTYAYTIEFTELKMMVSVRCRKAYAGSETHSGTEIVNQCDRTVEMWRYVLNQILAWEMVKIFKEERQKERFDRWQELSSHYSDGEGREKYAEWEQRGEDIREHRIYERIK